MYELTEYIPNRSYSRGDMVVLDGNIYECRVDNVGIPTLETGTLWRKLPTSNKSPQTIQNWNSSVSYSAGDLVTISYSTNIANGSLVFEALVDVDASQQFPSSAWNMLNDMSVLPNGIVYFSGDNFKQRQWAKNDVILRDDGLYVCNNSHTSTSYWSTTDTTNWTLVTKLPLRVYNYVTNKEYTVGDCVLYNNKLYVCIEDHVSSATFDSAKWATILYFIPNFIPKIVYYVGVCYFVQVWGEIYLTTVEHTNNGTSDSPNIDLSYNKLIGYALAGSGMNNNSEHHSIGEMTIFEGKLYYCTTPHNIPVGYIDLSKYEKMGIVPLSIFEWRPNVYYRGYYFVVHNNKIYYSKADVYSDTFNLEDWALAFVPTQWNSNTEYSVGQYVWYDGKLYMCKTPHISTATFDINFWLELGVYEEVTLDTIEDEVPELKLESGPIYVVEWKPFEHYHVGDYILYNGAIYRVLVDYVSSVFELQLDKIEPVVLDIPAYQGGKDYNIGDLILVDGKVLVCSVEHTGEYTIDLSKWKLYAINGTLLTTIPTIVDIEWKPFNDYIKTDIVTHENKFYVCIIDHTSSDNFNNDVDMWKEIAIIPRISKWKAEVVYFVGDIVEYNGDIYICVNGNADTLFDNTKWLVIAFSAIVEWQPNTNYLVNDIVLHENIYYICLTVHTSSTNFDDDIDYWRKLDIEFDIEDWVGSSYPINTIIKHDGNYYISAVDGTNINFTPSEWLIVDIKKTLEWQHETNYVIDDIVLHDGKFYKCVEDHTSTSGDFEEDSDYWLCLSNDFNVSDWEGNISYNIGDIVKLGEKLIICTVPNIDITFDPNNWEVVDIGSLLDWQPNTSYFIGNLVIYDGKLYRCIVDHTSNPNDFEEDLDNWKLLGEVEPIYEDGSLLKVKIGNDIYTILVNTPITIRGIIKISSFVEWQPNTNYLVDTVVIYDGRFYKCIVDHVSSDSFENDIDNWEDLGIDIVAKGTFYVNNLSNGKLYYIKEWQPNTDYKVDDVVIHNLYLYKCNTEHTSSSNFDDDSSYWDVVSSDIETRIWQPNTSYNIGDIIVHDGILYLVTATFVSGEDFDATNLDVVIELKDTLPIWQPNTDYKVNDVVMYYDEDEEKWKFYKCITEHTSLDTFNDEEKSYWEERLINSLFNIIPDGDKLYPKGYIVYSKDKDTLYISTKDHIGSNFDIELIDNYWKPIATNVSNAKPYTLYYEGEIVLSNDAIRVIPVTHTIGSSVDYDIDYLFKADLLTVITPYILEWSSNTLYYVGDIVLVGKQLFKCKEEHISGELFDEDEQEYWDKFATKPIIFREYKPNTLFNAGELLIVRNIPLDDSLIDVYYTTDLFTSTDFDNDKPLYLKAVINNLPIWKYGATYPKDTLVFYGNTILKVLPDIVISDFTKTPCMSIGVEDIVTNKEYKVNDMVRLNDLVLRCIVPHLVTDEELSILTRLDTEGIKEWQPNTDYVIGDIVKYDGDLYCCNTNHTSGDEFEPDVDKWDNLLWEIVRNTPTDLSNYDVISATSTIPSWQIAYKYYKGDKVVFDDYVYECISPYTSTADEKRPSSTNWSILYKIVDWKPNTVYPIGIILKYNGNLYTVVKNNLLTPTEFSIEGLAFNNIDVETDGDTIPVSKLKEWESNYTYEEGDYVLYGWCIYKCINPHVSLQEFSDDIDDFELVYANIPVWKPYTIYKIGDLVVLSPDDGQIYRAIVTHKSGDTIDNDKFVKVTKSSSSVPSSDEEGELTDTSGSNVVKANGKVYKYSWRTFTYREEFKNCPCFEELPDKLQKIKVEE